MYWELSLFDNVRPKFEVSSPLTFVDRRPLFYVSRRFCNFTMIHCCIYRVSQKRDCFLKLCNSRICWHVSYVKLFHSSSGIRFMLHFRFFICPVVHCVILCILLCFLFTVSLRNCPVCLFSYFIACYLFTCSCFSLLVLYMDPLPDWLIDSYYLWKET